MPAPALAPLVQPLLSMVPPGAPPPIPLPPSELSQAQRETRGCPVPTFCLAPAPQGPFTFPTWQPAERPGGRSSEGIWEPTKASRRHPQAPPTLYPCLCPAWTGLHLRMGPPGLVCAPRLQPRRGCSGPRARTPNHLALPPQPLAAAPGRCLVPSQRDGARGTAAPAPPADRGWGARGSVLAQGQGTARKKPQHWEIAVRPRLSKGPRYRA